ncbi:plectin-like [Alligator mississippiensis]|uniref:Plectin-like n=1 Tax=Alligator mississippiensis TaxID=8496 RepID=A0A151MCH1_ALLMI|nr:plectin-like [Alligator mississippiensis]
MMRGILSQGTALVLLEAQAASGFIIDPVMNRKLRVKDALHARVIGSDYYQKLLSAERAVTGYRDPCTGEKISLFQAMERGLIFKDHGIRLLEAQIATGGIIDPVHNHRVPVEDKRQELLELYRSRVLTINQMIAAVTLAITRADAASKKGMPGVSSPNRELMAVEEAADASSPQEQELDHILKSTTVDGPAGEYRGQRVSVWELLSSKYIPQQKRQVLLELYRGEVLPLEQMVTVITTIMRKAEARGGKLIGEEESPSAETLIALKAEDAHSQEEEDWEKTLKMTAVDVPVGKFQGKKVSVWDLLFSKYFPEAERKEVLELYHRGVLTLDQVVTVVTSIVTKVEAAGGKLEAEETSPSSETLMVLNAEADHGQGAENWEKALRATTVDVPVSEFQGKKVSVWDLLFSKYFPEAERKEVLELYHGGVLTLDQVVTVVTSIVTKVEAAGGKLEAEETSLSTETLTALNTDTAHGEGEKKWEKTLKATMVDVPVGEFKGRKVSVWELLFSNYIPKMGTWREKGTARAPRPSWHATLRLPMESGKRTGKRP